MTSVAKTIIATGVSSGLGFEAMRHLLERSQPYKIILGARNIQRTQEAFDALTFDRAANKVTILPLELNNLRDVQSFAKKTISTLGGEKIDYLMLNAAISNGSEKPGPYGSKWCESYIVNHLSQHYLVHLLREKLVESKSRIVFVSSGAIRSVPDPSVLDQDLKGGSGIGSYTIYPESKFVAFLAAHWWRRQLAGQCTVVAVSPGLIPNTNLFHGANPDVAASMKSPDAKSNSEGGANIIRALDRDDVPENPDQIFLTSWGEWWPTSVYENSLDKALQDKWSPTKDQIEQEEGLAA